MRWRIDRSLTGRLLSQMSGLRPLVEHSHLRQKAISEIIADRSALSP